MKAKLSIDLPTLEEITHGLDPHEVHPDLARAERALQAAEQDLEAARATFADRVREAGELPERVRTGKASAAELEAALRQERAAALLLPEHERTVAEMRQSLRGEMERATGLRQAEVERRLERLRAAVAELAPVLERIRDLEFELARALDTPQSLGLGLEWPCSWVDETALRNARQIASDLRSSESVYESAYQRKRAS